MAKWKYETEVLDYDQLYTMNEDLSDAIKKENEAEKLYALGWAFFSVISLALGPVGVAVTTYAAAEAVLALTNDDIEEVLLDCKSTIHDIERYLYENRDIEDVGVTVTFKGIEDSNTGKVYYYPYSCYRVGGR